MDPLAWLTEPYGSTFMQRAAIAALIVGAVVPTIGCWTLLRRLSYLGDAMSHGTLAGIAIGSLAGLSVTGGALAGGLVMSLVIVALLAHPRLREDTVVGIAESALFAIGLVVIGRYGSGGVDLAHLLLGGITTVGDDDLAVASALALLVLVGITLLFRDLRIATFDREHARQVGVRVDALALLLMMLLAVAIVVSLKVVGLLLSVGLLVIPPAAARMVTDRVVPMTFVAIGVGTAGSLTGLTLAYHLGTPAGATITLTVGAVLVLLAPVGARRQPRAG